MKRVAVIGAGISGLSAAWALGAPGSGVAATLFEAGAHFGGHAHTVDIELPGPDSQPLRGGVDTGFLVYNERTYPELTRLFATLGVKTAGSEMSFSVQAPAGLPGRPGRLEWSGSNLDTVFAQRANLFSTGFHRMLADLLRFNRLATALAERGDDATLAQPVGDFLDDRGFSAAFQQGYLLPMIACIWSCPTDQMLRFPMGTLIRFCHNHGLIQVRNRPPWRTVQGGSRHYVEALLARIPRRHANTPVRSLQRLPQGVRLGTDAGTQDFDAVVLACHSDQALALLGPQATPLEREVLGALRYQPNEAVLHTDTALMPRLRRAWAAWNYEAAERPELERSGVCLHYWLNRLQPLPWTQPVLVSLNPLREPDPRQVLARYTYSHPVFDLPAMKARERLPAIQGRYHRWFAGAWCGYGFHEDGLKAGLAAAQAVSEALTRPSSGADAPASWERAA